MVSVNLFRDWYFDTIFVEGIIVYGCLVREVYLVRVVYDLSIESAS